MDRRAQCQHRDDSRLLEPTLYPNIAPPTDGAPLMIAAEQGDAAAVKAMLAASADPNAREAATGRPR